MEPGRLGRIECADVRPRRFNGTIMTFRPAVGLILTAVRSARNGARPLCAGYPLDQCADRGPRRFTLKLKVTPVKKILIASLLLGTTPAYAWVDRAPTTEYHDLWGMTCSPIDNVPFKVITNDKVGGVLLIEGAHGIIRKNEIEDVQDIKVHGIKSMVVIANGFDYNGHHREIELHVSKQAGMLAVNRDIEHGIPCGPAVGVSDD